MEKGLTSIQKEFVTDKNTAKTMGSGELEVYATPAMVALMEKAAYYAVAPELEDGDGTVGIKMNIKHLAATPVGMCVEAKAELIEVDGRRLVFKVEASDEEGLIGEGEHERFIVNNNKFQSKADRKGEK